MYQLPLLVVGSVSQYQRLLAPYALQHNTYYKELFLLFVEVFSQLIYHMTYSTRLSVSLLANRKIVEFFKTILSASNWQADGIS